MEAAYTRRRRFWTTSTAVVMTLGFMVPLMWLIASAFRPDEEIFRHLSPLTLEALWPSDPTLANFQTLLSNGFGRTVFNSVFVAGVTVVIGLIVTSLAAFALSVYPFPGRSVVFAVVVVSFLIPFEGIAIPLAQTVRTLGVDNSYSALIAPGLANGFAIFLLRQFFMQIPRELVEAAEIDGASLFRIFFHVYLPLSKAPLVGAGVILFIFQWQAYLWPLLVTNDPNLELAPIALAKTIGQFNFDAGAMFAGALVLALIPVLVIFPLQRSFTSSVAQSGIK